MPLRSLLCTFEKKYRAEKREGEIRERRGEREKQDCHVFKREDLGSGRTGCKLVHVVQSL